MAFPHQQRRSLPILWWFLLGGPFLAMRATSFYWNRLPLQTIHNKRGSPISWHRLKSDGKVNNVNIKSTVQHQQSNSNSNNPSCNESFGLYVHIPYCRRRCNYCDFAIVPIGDSVSGGDDEENNIRTAGFQKMDEEYKNAILNEIKLIGKASHGKKIPLRSIYFGGGTPSLAPLSTLRDIMHDLLHSESAPFQLLDMDGDDTEPAEITIEMDPGTFDKQFLLSIKDFGFNRISLGVQSFDDNILSTMGRVHRSADIYNSVKMIAEVFGEDKANYSIDLISGVPGLSLAGWTEALHKAVSLRPKPRHISVYDLQVESGTTFGKWYADDMEDRDDDEGATQLEASVSPTTSSLGQVTHIHPSLPSADDCAFMYRYASGYLRARNYEHYEISSYALRDGNRQPHRSKHNQIYWEIGGNWHAIGLGATSNVNGARYSRPRALSDYIRWTKDLGEDGDSNVLPWTSKVSEDSDQIAADENDALLDIILTRLRTKDGLDLDWIANHEKYGDSYVEAIKKGVEFFEETELVTVSPGRVKLSDPDGFLFSNNIISNVFAELDDDTD